MSDITPVSQSADAAADDLPSLAPPEVSPFEQLEAAEARRKLFRARLAHAPHKRKPLQFSLGDAAALVTFFAVMMSAAHYLPVEVFAGAAGIAAFLVMAFEHRLPFRRLKAAWIVLSLGYVVAAVAALIRG